MYSLKDVNVREFALKDPVAFLSQTQEMMFIDEAQKAPELFEYIQGIVDNNPERKFLLSESSNFELMKGLLESLAGKQRSRIRKACRRLSLYADAMVACNCLCIDSAFQLLDGFHHLTFCAPFVS